MSTQDRSSFFLRDFEPSAVRLKRKLRLILTKTLRKKKLTDKNITLTEFVFYVVCLIVVSMLCSINRYSQEYFFADRCVRRLLVNKLELKSVKRKDDLVQYLYLANEELYDNVVTLQTSGSTVGLGYTHQLLLADENFVLGAPRLRQLRMDDTSCQVIDDLTDEPIKCYVIYDRSKEFRGTFIAGGGQTYNYTSGKSTAAFALSNVHGPYDTGGFLYQFRATKDQNEDDLISLDQNHWMNASTRAIVLEFIYFNPNTELLTSINILFEFLTSGIIESRDFFYTVPMNDYFFGRDKRMGVLQVLFIICHVTFAFYYIFKLATHRLSYIFSSTWNVYDLGLLVLFTVSLYFDILFLVNITHALACLSVPQEDIFKELIGFIGIQRTRINLQAFITTAVLIRLLRFLPHFSNLFANLLNVFYRSVQNSIAFLVLFFMIFMSFVMYATFHYGDELYEFHTFPLAAYTLIRCTLGQFQYDRAYRVSPTWTPIFYMLYVCVVFFVLLNLLIAIVNESYVLSTQEQKQIEDDLDEEYTHDREDRRIEALRRLKEPALRAAFMRLVNRGMTYFFNRSLDTEDSISIPADENEEYAEEDRASLEEKQNIVTEKLRASLREQGYREEVIEIFLQRILGNRAEGDDAADDEDDDNISLFRKDEEHALKVLNDEFKVFNNQYEKLAEDWRKTMQATRDRVLVNTVDIEQATRMHNHLNHLDQRAKKFGTLIPKLLENIVELYVNRTASK